MLTANSTFLSGAFKEDGFKESSQGEIHLTDEMPDAFEPFLCWLYTGEIKKATCRKDATDLTNLYVMADKFCLKSLQNGVMDVLREWYRKDYIMGPTIAYVYEHTMPGSALREYRADQCAWDIADSKMLSVPPVTTGTTSLAKRDFELQVKQNGDFAYDMCLAFEKVAALIKPDPSDKRGCWYHEHRSGSQCPSSIDKY